MQINFGQFLRRRAFLSPQARGHGGAFGRTAGA